MRRITVAATLLMLAAAACGVEPTGRPTTRPPVTINAEAFPIVGQPPTPDPPVDPSRPQPQVLLSPAVLSDINVTAPGGGRLDIVVHGDLPTPCHDLRAGLGSPDSDGVIQLTLWSQAPAGGACVRVLEPFIESLEIDGLVAGSYRIVMSGIEITRVELTTLAAAGPGAAAGSSRSSDAIGSASGRGLRS